MRSLFLLVSLLLATALSSRAADAAPKKKRKKPVKTQPAKPAPPEGEEEEEPMVEPPPAAEPAPAPATPPAKPATPPAKSATPPAKPPTPPAKPPTPPAADKAKPPSPADAGKPAPATATPPEPPEEKTTPPEKPPADAVDVDSLRKQYLALRDELFRSRARAATVGSAMYSSRIRVHLDYGTARFHTVTRAAVRLDGASVYDDAQGQIAQDKAPRFEGYVAPGRHLVTVRVEAAGKDDQRFTSALESSFVVQAPAGSDVIVKCKAVDDGDIAYQWQKSQEGSYKLRLDVSIDTARREKTGARAAKK